MREGNPIIYFQWVSLYLFLEKGAQLPRFSPEPLSLIKQLNANSQTANYLARLLNMYLNSTKCVVRVTHEQNPAMGRVQGPPQDKGMGRALSEQIKMAD